MTHYKQLASTGQGLLALADAYKAVEFERAVSQRSTLNRRKFYHDVELARLSHIKRQARRRA